MKIIGAAIAAVLIVGSALALFLGVVVLIGQGIETIGSYQEQYERCLKEATSPLEAKRCER